ncbi:U8 snoRNA-decapping enzyme-like [Ruditapes philippinarum]|uniref:U8 snoRNA-decapping enzyme-like n=1 Tax=Ruditapes philippinarum TaxID=129788 RepID=UPI00295B2D6D|nr:U8 snoRNA-decapping enzyme-like [Ruditapes philippinarum]
MIFARDERMRWNQQSTKAAVIMQMRFDGRFGFPGGHINNGEKTIVGLNRELKEELGLDISEFGFKETDYAVTYLHKVKKFVLHFFVKEVTLENLKTIESNCIHAQEFGVEALGCLRPPLYSLKDSFRGLPAFLCNQFAGNAKEELLFGLQHSYIIEEEIIEKNVMISNNILSKLA